MTSGGRDLHRQRSHRREIDTGELSESIPYLEFGNLIGKGHFSHVYLGSYHGKTSVAIKVIERGGEELISTEIELLSELRNCPGTVQLLEVIRGPVTILVFEYLPSMSSDHFFEHLSEKRLRFVLGSLLAALAQAHSRGIVHRDVKIGNIAIGPHFESVKLLDWGCGAYISDSMSQRAGSRSIRPPEMLFGHHNYGSGCDVWAVGVFILYVLTDGYIPWREKTAGLVLATMSEYFGGRTLMNYARQLNLDPPEDFLSNMTSKASKHLEDEIASSMSDFARKDLIDLMYLLMTIDMNQRPSAAEALQHPYFKGEVFLK